MRRNKKTLEVRCLGTIAILAYRAYTSNNILAESSIGGGIQYIVTESGVAERRPSQEAKNRYQVRNKVAAAHGCRAFCDTTMRNSGIIDPEAKKALMGWKLGIESHYYDIKDRKSQQFLLSEYIKVLPELTITKEYRAHFELKKKEDVISRMNARYEDFEERLKRLEGEK